MLVIKDVDPQGADAMALLHEASLDARALYPELFTDGSPSATNAPLGERSVYLVAYARGLPVACGAFRPLSESTAEVRRMYVHREHRRQGTARAVLAHLEQAALPLGYCRFVLETGCKQVPAMHLYEAWGFQRIPAMTPSVFAMSAPCRHSARIFLQSLNAKHQQ